MVAYGQQPYSNPYRTTTGVPGMPAGASRRLSFTLQKPGSNPFTDLLDRLTATPTGEIAKRAATPAPMFSDVSQSAPQFRSAQLTGAPQFNDTRQARFDAGVTRAQGGAVNPFLDAGQAIFDRDNPVRPVLGDNPGGDVPGGGVVNPNPDGGGRFGNLTPGLPDQSRANDEQLYADWSAGSGRGGDLNTFLWLRSKGPGMNMEDAETAAAYYSTFGNVNPAFYKINVNDVNAYRAANGIDPKSGQPMTLGDWYLAGNRGGVPRQTPNPETPPPQGTPRQGWADGTQVYDPNTGKYMVGDVPVVYDQTTGTWVPREGATPDQLGVRRLGQGIPPHTGPRDSLPTPPPAPIPNDQPQQGVIPNDGVPVSQDGVPPIPQQGTPVGEQQFTPTPGGPQLGNFNDVLERTIAEVQARNDPRNQRALNDLERRLVHIGSALGQTQAGGFVPSVGEALGGLSAEQSAQEGEQIAQLVQHNTQLAMTKYVAELDAFMKDKEIMSFAEIQKKAQELQKYGIDQNVFIEKLKAELGLKGQEISASAQVSAAQAHAAAAGAAAAASAEASRYAADLRYKSDILGADVARENNIMNFISRAGDQGLEWLRFMLGSDPLGILTGMQPPGDIVVKP